MLEVVTHRQATLQVDTHGQEDVILWVVTHRQKDVISLLWERR